MFSIVRIILTLLMTCTYAYCHFEPLDLPKEFFYKNDKKELGTIQEFLSFIFVKKIDQEKKIEWQCFALVYGKLRDRVLLKINNIAEKPAHWEYIPLPVSQYDVLFCGALGNEVGLLVQSKPHFWSKSSYEIKILSGSGKWESLYRFPEGQTAISFTGNSAKSWWAQAIDERGEQYSLRLMPSDYDGSYVLQKMPYSIIIATERGEHIWKAGYNKDGKLLLETEEIDDPEFNVKIVPNIDILGVQYLAAYDDESAFFTTYYKIDWQNLNRITNEGSVIGISLKELNSLGDICIGFWDDVLIVATDNKLYRYVTLEPLQVTIKAQSPKPFPVPENKQEKPLDIEFVPVKKSESTTVVDLSGEEIAGEPISIDVNVKNTEPKDVKPIQESADEKKQVQNKRVTSKNGTRKSPVVIPQSPMWNYGYLRRYASMMPQWNKAFAFGSYINALGSYWQRPKSETVQSFTKKTSSYYDRVASYLRSIIKKKELQNISTTQEVSTLPLGPQFLEKK